jgi:RND family efflux transporter MFP subunit
MRVIDRVVLLSVLVVLSFGSSPSMAQGGPPPANVVVDLVKSEDLVRRRVVTGEIRSKLSSSLASQVESLLVEMNIEEGDVVEQGFVVARLDDARALIQVERSVADVDYAKAVVAQREAERDNAYRELDRVERLNELGSSGVSQLDEARTLFASREALLGQAKAELVSAEGELELAKRELEDMTIEAPFSGRVTIKHMEIGEWVGRGDAIVSIVSLDELEARVDIPEDVYGAVADAKAHGGKIEMALPAMSERVYGDIESILPSADSLSRLFPVRIVVDDQGGRIRPGMSLQAWVPTGEPGSFLTVSKDAIVRTATGEVVYWSNDGVSALAPVTRLFAVGDRVAVRSPVLRDGMSVVVSGNERLFPGQKLMVQERSKGVDLSGSGSGVSDLGESAGDE